MEEGMTSGPLSLPDTTDDSSFIYFFWNWDVKIVYCLLLLSKTGISITLFTGITYTDM